MRGDASRFATRFGATIVGDKTPPTASRGNFPGAVLDSAKAKYSGSGKTACAVEKLGLSTTPALLLISIDYGNRPGSLGLRITPLRGCSVSCTIQRLSRRAAQHFPVLIAEELKRRCVQPSITLALNRERYGDRDDRGREQIYVLFHGSGNLSGSLLSVTLVSVSSSQCASPSPASRRPGTSFQSNWTALRIWVAASLIAPAPQRDPELRDRRLLLPNRRLSRRPSPRSARLWQHP